MRAFSSPAALISAALVLSAMPMPARATLDVVAISGTVALPGVEFRGQAIGGLSINSADQLAFTFEAQSTTMTAVRGAAVWLRTDEGLTLVAGPAFPGVTRLIDFEPDIPSHLGSQLFFADDGTIYMMAREGANDAIYALHTSGAGSVDVIAREGDAAPGGGIYADLDGFHVHPTGPLLFGASVGGVRGAYLHEGGAVRRVVSMGDALLGYTVDALNEYRVDARGSVYFKATVSDTMTSFEGIFVHASDSFSLVVAPEPEAMDAVAAIGSFDVFPRAGLVWEGQRWVDSGGGSFGAEAVMRRVAVDGAVTTLLSSASDLGGATYSGAFQFRLLGDLGVAVAASVDRGGAGLEEALVSVDLDGGPWLHAVVRQPIDGVDHQYGAIGQLAGPDIGNILVAAFDTGGNDVIDSHTPGAATGITFTGDILDFDVTIIAQSASLFRSATIGRPVSTTGVPCLFVTDDGGTSMIACGETLFDAPSEGSLLVEGSLMGPAGDTHIAATAWMDVEEPTFTLDAPTWRVEGTFSAPVLGGRVFIDDDGAETPEACEFRTDGALVTGFVCSQTDSTLFPIVGETFGSADFLVTALVDVPPNGILGGTLTVDWSITGQDEFGRTLTPGADSATLEGITTADASALNVGDEDLELYGPSRVVRFEMLDNLTNVPVEIRTDFAPHPPGFCSFEFDGSEHVCRTTLSFGVPLEMKSARDVRYVRISVPGDGFPVDNNPDNDEVLFDPIFDPDSGEDGCSASGTPAPADALLGVLLLAFLVRRRR